MKRGLVILAALLAAGCGTSGATTVDWENSLPGLQALIDSQAAAKDCRGLQAQFDLADRGDKRMTERVGSGNADLMRYIDDKLKAAGCY